MKVNRRVKIFTHATYAIILSFKTRHSIEADRQQERPTNRVWMHAAVSRDQICT